MKKSRKHDENMLPSSDEQRQLQQLEILMRNNLINLQTKELLQQVDPSYKYSSKKLQEWLATLLIDLKDVSAKTCHGRVISANWLKKQNYNGFELVNATGNEDFSIDYTSPQVVEVLGSYNYGTGVAPFYNIDIAVQIPVDIIQPR